MRLSRLYFLLPLSLLVLGYFHHITAYNQDLGRHLKTGEIILKTFHVPATNLFSYTYPDFPFINHHWGAEVLFFITHALLGDPGLFSLSLIVIGTACSIVFYQAQKKATIIPLIITSLLYLRVLFERTDLRPELLSFLFLSLMITILYHNREKATKLIFLLPVIELLWANTHIYFPIGILVLLLFLIDAGITERKNLVNIHTKTLLGIFLVTGLMALINPHFITGALYPLRVFQNYGYTIEENQTPFFLQSLGFHKPSFLYLELAVILLFSSLFISIKRSRPIDWLLSVTFAIIALSAVRNFPLFVFATFIPCSLAFSDIFEPILKKIKTKPPILFMSLITCIVLLYVWQSRTVLSLTTFGYGVDNGAKNALDFVERNHVKGPMFNNFDIGSYIEARLYPQERVFIDGRPEAYPASFIQNTYIKMQQDPVLFAKISEQYHFNTIIFSHTDQTPWADAFTPSIIRNPDWIPIYLDQMMLILVKNTPENQALIKKYGMNLETYSSPLPTSERELRQLAHFYAVANLPQQLEGALLKLNSINPTDCSVLGNLAQLYTQQNNPSSQIYISRYQMNCLR